MSEFTPRFAPPEWHSPILRTALGYLERALGEIHPEHGEHDTVQAAMNAIEDADIALERMAKMRRGGSSQSDGRGL